MRGGQYVSTIKETPPLSDETNPFPFPHHLPSHLSPLDRRHQHPPISFPSIFHTQNYTDGTTMLSTKNIVGNSKETGNAGRAHAKRRIQRKAPGNHFDSHTRSTKTRYEHRETKIETPSVRAW